MSKNYTNVSRLAVGVLIDEGFQNRRDLLLLRAWEL